MLSWLSKKWITVKHFLGDFWHEDPIQDKVSQRFYQMLLFAPHRVITAFLGKWFDIHSKFYTIWLVLAPQKMSWKKKGSKWEINLNVFLLLITLSTANMKKGSSVLTPLSTKLCNVLAPNLWDTPVLLTSLESRRWFRMWQDSLFLQISKETSE